MPSMSEDKQLMAALEASAREHQSTHSKLKLKSRFSKPRSETMRDDWPDMPQVPCTGVMLQINTFDQFNHEKFGRSIAEFNAPTAICGYASMAGVLALARHLPETGLKGQEAIEVLASKLRDVDALLPDIRRAMSFVAKSRRRYIEDHPASFKSRREEDAYMKAWVANYEISDFLKAEGVAGTFFMRFNQWPERKEATHEESERLLEEQRFGGAVGNKSSSVMYDYAAGDAMFIVEEFGAAEHRLVSAREWLSSCTGRPTSGAFVLDLNGHFAVAAPVASLDGEPALLMFNTTSANYLSGAGGLVSAATYDLVFSDPPSGHASTGRKDQT